MIQFMLWLFASSAAGTVLFFVLCAAKPVTRRLFSQTWHYYMSFLPIAMLLGAAYVVYAWLPLPSLPSAMDTPPATASNIQAAHDVVGNNFGGCASLPVLTPAALPIPAVASESTPAHPLLVMPLQVRPMLQESQAMRIPQPAVALALSIWAVVVAILFARQMLRYVKFKRKLLGDCKPTEISSTVLVLASKNASTPMMLGFFRPIIVMPAETLNSDALKMIVAHEMVHVRRGDIWLKFAVLLANALHWFNPAAYAMSRYVRNLCELSCDEAVVTDLDITQRRTYGMAILVTLQTNASEQVHCANSLTESAKNIQERLMNMLRTEKVRRFSFAMSILAAVLIVGVGGVIAYTVGAMTYVEAEDSAYVPKEYYNANYPNDTAAEYVFPSRDDFTSDAAYIIAQLTAPQPAFVYTFPSGRQFSYSSYPQEFAFDDESVWVDGMVFPRVRMDLPEESGVWARELQIPIFPTLSPDLRYDPETNLLTGIIPVLLDRNEFIFNLDVVLHVSRDRASDAPILIIPDEQDESALDMTISMSGDVSGGGPVAVDTPQPENALPPFVAVAHGGNEVVYFISGLAVIPGMSSDEQENYVIRWQDGEQIFGKLPNEWLHVREGRVGVGMAQDGSIHIEVALVLPCGTEEVVSTDVMLLEP